MPAEHARGYAGDRSQAFPNPQLEEDEIHELREVRDAEEEKLYTYGWVDQNAGTVHIPIERAMQLIVERGLPTQVKAGVTPAFDCEYGTAGGGES